MTNGTNAEPTFISPRPASRFVMGESLVLARDLETDDALKERYIEQMTEKAFGGNFADYLAYLKSIVL